MTPTDILTLCSVRNPDISNITIDAQILAQHGVAGWVCAIHPELRNAEIRQYVLTTLLQNQRNIAICNKLQTTLAAEGISMALLKGAALMTKHYADISQRPIGDIDIWVSHNNVYKAYQILKKISTNKHQLGFRSNILQESIKTHLPELCIDGQIIELHYAMYSQDSDKNPSEQLAEHIDTDGQFQVPDDVMMLYHLTTHIIKNRQTKGLRAGWIVDIVMLFEKWGGEKSATLCRTAMQLNSHYANEMLNIWRYVVSLNSTTVSNIICNAFNVSELPITDNFTLSTNKGYKHGLSTKFRSVKCILSAICTTISETHGLKNKMECIIDIAYDILNRKKY